MNNFSKNDIEDIVEIHLSTLPDDLLPQLGRKYLLYFYKYLVSSTRELIFVNRSDNRVVGVCIVSIEPKTLFYRVLKNTFFNFLYCLFIGVIKSKLLRNYLLSMIFSKNRIISEKPEIVYIFTKQGQQGRGIGRGLLNNIEKYLAIHGFSELFVKTINCSQNTAIDFYKNNQFVQEQIIVYAGKEYLYFKKSLNV